MKKYLVKLSVFALALPFMVSAQNNISARNLDRLLETVKDLLDTLVPIVIGLAVIFFLWGLLKFVVAKEEKDRESGRYVMLNGIIVLAVMVSIWGLVNFLTGTLGLDTSTPDVPELPGL